jgi:uncharacterized ferritin-like protein (DUF455 family)
MHAQEPSTAASAVAFGRAATIERFCAEFIRSSCAEQKLAPAAPPDSRAEASWESEPVALRIEIPGRPAGWRVVSRSPSAPRPDALRSREARARLLHTFVHHELQAAELFAWAVLAFPRTPREFRAGLVRLCKEELAHLALYRGLLRRDGHEFGDFPVRDWFWQRVPSCATPEAFVALQGLGLEGANLEHSRRYAEAFRAAGDDEGASVLEKVERDEVGHVAFAARWFEHFTDAPLDYDRWRSALPSPLTPAVLQGRPLNRRARQSAGLDDAFLARLESEPRERGVAGPRSAP